jgi:hypothetical protein
MAQERRRLEEQAEDEAKRRAKDQAETERLGPKTVTGPDGVPVRLWVLPSGMPGLAGAMPTDADGCLILLPLILIVGLLGWLNHLVIFRRGHTVHVEPKGGRTVKLRERSEEAAAQRMAWLAAAIERDGLADRF